MLGPLATHTRLTNHTRPTIQRCVLARSLLSAHTNMHCAQHTLQAATLTGTAYEIYLARTLVCSTLKPPREEK